MRVEVQLPLLHRVNQFCAEFSLIYVVILAVLNSIIVFATFLNYERQFWLGSVLVVEVNLYSELSISENSSEFLFSLLLYKLAGGIRSLIYVIR